ncbi:MAG: glycerophosphodiester phosphodiesterase family protein [Anaerolineales bacterium]|jgi:glycerophosphoryl diester phosphodiesterase
MWLDLTTPLVIAHRGDSIHAPENTLAAFEAATRQGADAIEFDVQLTRDGQVIVLHDPTVDRTTDGTGNVTQLDLPALRELDAGSSFSAQFHGEPIPTLNELFEAVGKRLYLNVELPKYATPLDGLVPKVAEMVRQHALEERVLFSSFLPRDLSRMRKILPSVPRGLLTHSGWRGGWGRVFGWRGDYAVLHPYLTDLDNGLVRRVHAARKRVHVWTVNAEVDIRRVISLGVDGIITDDPALACRLLGRLN